MARVTFIDVTSPLKDRITSVDVTLDFKTRVTLIDVTSPLKTGLHQIDVTLHLNVTLAAMLNNSNLIQLYSNFIWSFYIYIIIKHANNEVTTKTKNILLTVTASITHETRSTLSRTFSSQKITFIIIQTVTFLSTLFVKVATWTF